MDFFGQKCLQSAHSKDLVLIETVAEIHTILAETYDEDKCEAIAEATKQAFLGATSDHWQAEAADILSTFECEAVQRLFPSGAPTGRITIIGYLGPFLASKVGPKVGHLVNNQLEIWLRSYQSGLFSPKNAAIGLSS